MYVLNCCLTERDPVCYICPGLIEGGAASAANAANIDDDIDELSCDDLDQLPAIVQQTYEEICDDAE